MPITRHGGRGRGDRDPRVGYGRTRWQLTAPAVLLLLTEGPSHGYELLSRLRPMLPRDDAPPDTGGLYRLLRGLEDDGLLRSSWVDNPGAGPRRRVYELTDSGRDTLDECASSIAGEIHAMSGLLAAYYHRASEPHVRKPSNTNRATDRMGGHPPDLMPRAQAADIGLLSG